MATREEPILREDFKTDGSHMNRAVNIAGLATRNASGGRYDPSIPWSEGN
jgi:hypothetical protein